jgi:hypothetical protein
LRQPADGTIERGLPAPRFSARAKHLQLDVAQSALRSDHGGEIIRSSSEPGECSVDLLLRGGQQSLVVEVQHVERLDQLAMRTRDIDANLVVDVLGGCTRLRDTRPRRVDLGGTLAAL